MIKKTVLAAVTVLVFSMPETAVPAEPKIAHDAEYYILQAQNAEKWAADDRAVDEILAAFRERNGGKLSWVRSGRKSDHLITSAVEG